MQLIAPFVALSASLTCSAAGDTRPKSVTINGKPAHISDGRGAQSPTPGTVLIQWPEATGTYLKIPRMETQIRDGTPTVGYSSDYPSSTRTVDSTSPIPTDYTDSMTTFLTSLDRWTQERPLFFVTVHRLKHIGPDCPKNLDDIDTTTSCGKQASQILRDWKTRHDKIIQRSHDDTIIARQIPDGSCPMTPSDSDSLTDDSISLDESLKDLMPVYCEAEITRRGVGELEEVGRNCTAASAKHNESSFDDTRYRKQMKSVFLDWRHKSIDYLLDLIQQQQKHDLKSHNNAIIARQSDVSDDDPEDQDEPADTTSSQDLSYWIRKFNLVLNTLKVTQQTGEGQNATVEQVSLVLNQFVAAHNESIKIAGRSVDLASTSYRDEDQDSDLDQRQGPAYPCGFLPGCDIFVVPADRDISKSSSDSQPLLLRSSIETTTTTTTLVVPRSASASTTLTSDSSTITVFIPVSTPAFTMACSVDSSAAFITSSPSPSLGHTSTCYHTASQEIWTDNFCTSLSRPLTITADQGVRLIDIWGKGQAQDILKDYQAIHGTKTTKYVPDPEVPGPKPCVYVYGSVKLIGHDCRVPLAMGDAYFHGKGEALAECRPNSSIDCDSPEGKVVQGQAVKERSGWKVKDTILGIQIRHENWVSIPPEVSADLAAEMSAENSTKMSAENSTKMSDVKSAENVASSHSGVLLVVMAPMLAAIALF